LFCPSNYQTQTASCKSWPVCSVILKTYAQNHTRYDLGLIGGAMLGISQAFSITSVSTKEAIVGAAKLGACFGTFLGGALMLRYGRRRAIAAESVFFVAGPLVMAAATGPR
jgi:MFS family permease